MAHPERALANEGSIIFYEILRRFASQDEGSILTLQLLK
jgi:hypothetical protein